MSQGHVSFQRPRPATLATLAAHVGGALVGNDAPVTGVAGIREAEPGHVTFLANSRYLADLARTRA